VAQLRAIGLNRAIDTLITLWLSVDTGLTELMARLTILPANQHIPWVTLLMNTLLRVIHDIVCFRTAVTRLLILSTSALGHTANALLSRCVKVLVRFTLTASTFFCREVVLAFITSGASTSRSACLTPLATERTCEEITALLKETGDTCAFPELGVVAGVWRSTGLTD
jgi:hypothetical protein